MGLFLLSWAILRLVTKTALVLDQCNVDAYIIATVHTFTKGTSGLDMEGAENQSAIIFWATISWLFINKSLIGFSSAFQLLSQHQVCFFTGWSKSRFIVLSTQKFTLELLLIIQTTGNLLFCPGLYLFYYDLEHVSPHALLYESSIT